jgi:hypothetical protein
MYVEQNDWSLCGIAISAPTSQHCHLQDKNILIFLLWADFFGTEDNPW